VPGIIVRVIRTRSVVTSVVAWTVGASLALAVSLLALSMVSTGLTTGPFQPVTRDVGAPANQATPTPPPIVSDTATSDVRTTVPAPSRASASERSLSSLGGTVVARCQTGGTYLVYWSPAPGYRVDNVVRGPAQPARVSFEGQGREVKVSVTCVNGTPQATTREEPHLESSP
jgi:hypothetical protein